jgi:hypothetical protein
MQRIYGAKNFDFIPPTFALPKDHSEFRTEFIKEKERARTKSKCLYSAAPEVVPWIVKPVNLSRGRGIRLITDLNQITREDEPCVVSK